MALINVRDLGGGAQKKEIRLLSQGAHVTASVTDNILQFGRSYAYGREYGYPIGSSSLIVAFSAPKGTYISMSDNGSVGYYRYDIYVNGVLKTSGYSYTTAEDGTVEIKIYNTGLSNGSTDLSGSALF